MPAKKHIVQLTLAQRQQLETIVTSNKTSIRQRTHARILLAADAVQAGGALKDEAICHLARSSAATVERVRQRFCETGLAGLEGAVWHKPQLKRKARALDGQSEAHLIALACSAPPDGRKRWALHLLRDKLIELQIIDNVSPETVRQTLKKTNLSPG